jgi:hypothetical protein
VVLRQGILAAWFFTSLKDGSVKKKKRHNLLISNVINHFCRPRPPEFSDLPVAFFVAYESEKVQDPVHSIKYIMANELEVCQLFCRICGFMISDLTKLPVQNFLRPVSEVVASQTTGFLQQWTHPSSNNNYLIHCLWSPSAIQVRIAPTTSAPQP